MEEEGGGEVKDLGPLAPILITQRILKVSFKLHNYSYLVRRFRDGYSFKSYCGRFKGFY